MSYIKSVQPMEGHRLYLEMEGGSAVIVDLTNKLHTIKYLELLNADFFNTASTDGDYVIWGEGRLKLTVNELMEVVLLG